jgi:hypothetical protein
MSNEKACIFGMCMYGLDTILYLIDRTYPRFSPLHEVLHLSLALITNSNIPPFTPTRPDYLNKDRSTVKRVLRDVHFVAGCCEGDMYA